tara:strand:+ start:4804 stop:4986 length:183 start_codon:yes stop_codon:yes gene_type:complete
MSYKITKTTNLATGEEQETHITETFADGSQLVFRKDSTDIGAGRRYQEWVAAGNTPEAAD